MLQQRRGRSQKHQNAYAFHHNKNSAKTAKILASPNEGLCQKCYDKIEWRKKYRKYKPLTQPKKCAKCNQKTVRHAYHIICANCAKSNSVCAKCLENPMTVTFDDKTKHEEDQMWKKLALLPERQRRTFLRQLERGELDDDINQDNMVDRISSGAGSDRNSVVGDVRNNLDGSGSDDDEDELDDEVEDDSAFKVRVGTGDTNIEDVSQREIDSMENFEDNSDELDVIATVSH